MLQDSETFSGFSVDEISKAKQFYSEILKLNVEEHTEPMAMLTLHLKNGNNVLVYAKGEQHSPATFTVLNFIVEDINRAVDDLVAKGVEFIKYNNPEMPQDEKGILRGLSNNMGPDIAWFSDPAGNIMSVNQNQ